ncbi:MAG: MBL fold metallo-hydrolase [Myxococcota bacterium]|nr:MBL fold metallo-hydrolase [Myxococcota bacterium]
MDRWEVGGLRVSRLVELETTSIGSFVLPDAVAENVRARDWLRPHFADADGNMIMSIHALLIEAGDRRIIVDTCLGNDKQRPIPDWNMRKGPFLEDLAAAGFPPESIDTVVCTHLHVDHVGWNTMLVDGRWVPTFPNARYLIGRSEWDYWNKEEDGQFGEIMGDSVRPVIEAGLADLVEPGLEITPGVRLISTPGHTPGHMSVFISSRGSEAVITGDLIHHPVQCSDPEWASAFDFDPEQARKTRREFLERYADTEVRVIGTHFASPTIGKIVRHGESWRFLP